MSKITHYLHAEIDLSRPPDKELIDVTAAVLQAYPGKEREILTDLKTSIEQHLKYLEKEAKARDGKPLRESSRQ